MPRLIPALAVALACLAPAAAASAQTSRPAPPPALRLAATASGGVQGVVRDAEGQALAGVSVIAVGSTLASARSDAKGQFRLRLPAGEYVIRATRVGYLSNYREPVRIQSSVLVERNITLVELDPVTAAAPIRAAMGLDDEAQPVMLPGAIADDDHAHGVAAWRLRHLTRTILRETGETAANGARGERLEAEAFAARGSFLDRALFGSARAARSFFADTEFSGQVNLLATGAFGADSGFLPGDWQRGVAYLSVGAPVGRHGDWHVRGAMTPGDLSSWVFLGEFQSRGDQAHAYRLGMSYGVQGDITARGRYGSSMPDTRSAGAFYGADHWAVSRRLDVDYGLRLDRYDYVPGGGRLSPSLGVRAAIVPGLSVTAAASQRVIAPGATEFLPPESAGPWLPPERTFSALGNDRTLQAERVRHFEVGIDQALGRTGHAPTAFVRRFHQTATDQVATLFGLDRTSSVGHYYVANAGNVALDGWRMGVSGQVTPWLGGEVAYTTARSDWSGVQMPRLVRWQAPSVPRTGAERLNDVTMTLDATVPEVRTQVKMAYRVSTAFSGLRRDADAPSPGGRFEIELRQALPYQPIRGGRLEVLFAVRNLFMDPADGASFYDELLTVAPPLRLMGGLQIRF
ncbi:MAG: TonB-dependent receptor [Vicinamibacterales bacterium]